MGLESYVFRIIKPEPLNEEVVTEDELHSVGLSFIRITGLDPQMFQDLIPYSLQARVITPNLDMDGICKVYGKSVEDSCRAFHGDGSIDFLTSDAGVVHISADELQKKYTVNQEEPALLFFSEKVAYWRKNYSVQSFFYEHILGIENTGFYLISKKVLEQYHKLSRKNAWLSLPPEAPSEYTALFYHEWY